MMRILVTGAAGFIGSHVARELAQRGHEVVAADMFMDRLYGNGPKVKNWESLGQTPNVQRVVADLRGDLRDLPHEFDVIVNEAGMAGLMTSWSEFDTYLSCNLKIVENLLTNRVGKGTHFVQISTSSVYGQTATGDETSACMPTSPYGVTKLAAEELIRAYHRTHGLQHTILRYFSVFGPGQRPDMAYHKLISSIAAGREFTVYGDGQQSRTNTYVEDCASITATVAESQPTNDVFNVSGAESVSLNDAIAIVQEIIGKPAILAHAATREGDQRVTEGAIGKIGERFGYAPTTGFREGIRSQIDWQLGS